MSQKHADLLLWVYNNDQNNEHLPMLGEMIDRINDNQGVLELQSITIQLQSAALAAQKNEIENLKRTLEQLRSYR